MPRPVAIYLCESNKCFLCESKATATNVFCAKAKRQLQLRQGEIDIDTLRGKRNVNSRANSSNFTTSLPIFIC
ncbi:hypothetical protein [Lysinibacillus sp. fls2-241-R2A-57]|uniref:hypothetical protein n=1 Tax=Lysinibacillus sp. fls2-241-R2A-57 TaxID=3040292 RepID=UPI002556B624|nr:hypothetical protein [Lysinibacillus sp. fls2-241-R2A-57]